MKIPQLSERDQQIALMLVNGALSRDLEKKYGLSRSRIHQIGKKWIHINYLTCYKAKMKRRISRPIDMGGPRDVWIENLPHENL